MTGVIFTYSKIYEFDTFSTKVHLMKVHAHSHRNFLPDFLKTNMIVLQYEFMFLTVLGYFIIF